MIYQNRKIYTKFIYSILIFFSFIIPAYSQNSISNGQAIEAIEKSLLKSDDKDDLYNIQIIPNAKGKSSKNNGLIDIKINNRKNSEEIRSKQQTAYRAALSGQYEVAVEIYKKVLKLDGSNSYARFGLATCYHKLGQYNQAKNLYYMLLNQVTENKNDIISNLLSIIIEQSPNEAIYLLSRLSLENPNSPYIISQSAVAYSKIGKIDQAILLLERAISLNPKNIGYHLNLAILYDKNEQYKQALDMYQKVVSEYANQNTINESVPIIQIKRRIKFIQNEKSV